MGKKAKPPICVSRARPAGLERRCRQAASPGRTRTVGLTGDRPRIRPRQPIFTQIVPRRSILEPLSKLQNADKSAAFLKEPAVCCAHLRRASPLCLLRPVSPWPSRGSSRSGELLGVPGRDPSIGGVAGAPAHSCGAWARTGAKKAEQLAKSSGPSLWDVSLGPPGSRSSRRLLAESLACWEIFRTPARGLAGSGFFSRNGWEPTGGASK